MWDVLANSSTVMPPYYLMETAYDDYKHNHKPAGHYPTNQCAVRMSIALGRSGFSLAAFPNSHRLVTHPHIPVPYVMGAEELANYVKKYWHREVFKHHLDKVAGRLSGRKGVVYFNNCFRRVKDGPKVGDHIDLWNGQHYYNDLYHILAGEADHASNTHLFTKSDEVWFFELA